MTPPSLPADIADNLFTDAGKSVIIEYATRRITILLEQINGDLFTFAVCRCEPGLGRADTYSLKLLVRYSKAVEYPPVFLELAAPTIDDKIFNDFYVDAQLSHMSVLLDNQHSLMVISQAVDDLCHKAVDHMLAAEYGTSFNEESRILRDRFYELQKTNMRYRTTDSEAEIYKFLKYSRRDELDAMGVKVRRETEEHQRLAIENRSSKYTRRLRRKFTAPWRA